MNFSQKLFLLTFLILVSNIHAVKRFIFRLDDIQDWYYSSAQQQLLNWFMNNNIPVTAGIISDVFTAEDPDLYPVLQRCAGMTKDKCALFNHGRNGAYLFGNAPSVADAQAQIQACDDTITTYFPGYQVELFVPHQNSWNQYTLQAVRNVGYLAISASVLSYSNLPWNLFSNPLQLSQQTETGEYNPNGWTAWPIATAVSDCDAATARGEDCVIMVHPYEFGDGTYTFSMLQDLINRLKAKGYTATSFHTVIQEAKGLTNSPTRSPTLKPTTVPTAKPSTRAPTAKPTIKPTITPGASVAPTVSPTQAVVTGTPIPTVTPTRSPTSATTKKRFIFRLDDIQDWYFSSWQQQILTWLMDRGYPVSAGIIGDYFDAQDPALYPVLKRCAGMTKDKCALFNHGKDAAYIFANSLSVAEAQAQILSCDTKIKTYFPGYQVDLFVPHQNSWNSYVLQAVRNLGYSAISASTLSYSNLQQSLTTNPIQLSQQTETGEYNPDGTWSAWPIDTAVADCEAAMARGDAACVIMMHPFEFGNGKYTFAMLQQLIDKLTALGYSATSFDAVIREVKNIPGSPTMAPTTAVPTRPPTVSPTVNPLLTAPAWGQCGGLLYLGPTTCVNGYTCVLSSIWYSQCKPATVADVVASLTYQINVPIADIQGSLFSTSSEAAIMLAIRNIEENAGHHVDDLVVKSVQQISGANRKLRTIDGEQAEIQPASSASNVFKVTLAMTLLVENGQTAKNIYTDSTSALTTSVKNGLLQTQFRNYALKFDASESKRGSITSMSFSNYDYNNAPDSSTTKTNDKAKTVNMLVIAIPIGVGLLLFVVISYLVLGYYRHRNELTKKAHHDEIFATFSDNIFKDYKVSTQEHNSMEFLSDNFIYRHGMGSDIQYSTVASKSADIDVATNCDTVSECASVIILNDV